MSISGGFARAVESACEVRATALQVFVKSARQWSGRPLAEAEARAFRRLLRRHDLERHTLAHASYLINLASPSAAIRERSIAALADEIERCARLGIPSLVLHPGSHLGRGEESGLERVASALDRALAGRRSGAVRLLLENTAGQGSNLGHRFEQLARVLELSRSSARLGICLDTCHAVAAGYGLADARSYRRTLADLDRTVGLSRLCAFHLNDSKFAQGSRRDRHAHIGEGRVGLEAFRRILADPRFRGLPMVLETPKDRGLDADRRNLALLRGLARRGRRRA